jgi:hypothetical protein
MTACVGCEIQRSGLPRRCERNIRAVVHGPAAAIAQTVDNLVDRMYERVRRFIRSKWKHDAALQHAGKGKGQTANGHGMSRVRAPQTGARPARRKPSILRALSLTTTRGELRRRARTRRARPRGACSRRRRSHRPCARELRASHPAPCGASTRTRAGLARDARLASLLLRKCAHSRRRAHSAY